MNKEVWYEMMIDEGESGTRTIDTDDDLKALKSRADYNKKLYPDVPMYIDKWNMEDDTPMPDETFKAIVIRAPKNTAVKTEPRALNIIAKEILATWGKGSMSNINYAARPYLSAMRSLGKIEDRYVAEDGHEIVARFLANARAWRGDDAKRIKKELNDLLKK